MGASPEVPQASERLGTLINGPDYSALVARAIARTERFFGVCSFDHAAFASTKLRVMHPSDRSQS
jgi:hypothetical protein